MHYRFNLHENGPDRNSNLSIKAGADQMPEFNFAFSETKCEFLTERKDNPKTKKVDFQYVPVVVWHIWLFREPENMLMTIFAPIFLLNLMLLAVYLQGPSVAKQLANIAMILLALLAYMPIFRGSIPPQTNLTLGDMVILRCLLNTVICFLMTICRFFFGIEDSEGNWDVGRDRIITYVFGAISGLFVFGEILFMFGKYGVYKSSKEGFDTPWKTVKRSGATHLFSEWTTLPL